MCIQKAKNNKLRLQVCITLDTTGGIMIIIFHIDLHIASYIIYDIIIIRICFISGNMLLL